MQRRFVGFWFYVGTFCTTFIVTFLLLHESQTPSFKLMPGKLIERSDEDMASYQADPNQRPQSGETSENSKDREEHPIDSDEPIPARAVAKECSPDSPRQILMLTYGRSGSSLTSDIISEHPDVFFYFEPLHNLAKSYSRQQDEYWKKHKRYLHLTEIPEYNTAALHMLEKQLSCDYHRLNRFASLNLHAKSYNNTRELYSCVQRALTSKTEEICLLEAQERCQLKPIKFIKTIRLAASSAASLLETFPCLKVVYLVRDPRGSFYSKQKMFASHSSNVTFEAERFCTRLNRDIDSMVHLKKLYPDRVLMTRFESIATHPIVSSKRLYEFLGLKFTRKIALFAYSKTHSDNEGHGYDTHRSNALEACYKWREKIPFNFVEAFDNFCSEPFFKMGYLPANSVEDMRNMDKTLLFQKEHFS